MQLSKNNLFISILAFMLIVNLLVIFNLNQFYIRAILVFIFIITIPGLLIMLCLKIRNISFWEYFVYTIGLSVSFIMFAGLAVNWILPWLNITDKPLSLWPILICFDTILLALWLVAYKRNYDLKLDIRFPKFSWLDRIFILWALCFPFMAVVGAFLLNNHGTNIVTMTMLGMIALYVLLIVIFRDKLNENVFPWALWMIGLSLLLSGWMRSWYLTGIDNSLEYYIFELTSLNGFWSINYYRNAYNAMLSLNILPIIINSLSLDDIRNYFIFKFFFQIIVSTLSIILFVYFNKIFNKTISFLSVIFFVSLPMFYSGTSLGIRQQIAFLFLGLILLILFSKEILHKIKSLFFIIFGFAMIVSHYSTAYIALTILIIFTILSYLQNKILNNNSRKPRISLVILVILVIGGFLWYIQITPTGYGVINFLSDSTKNMNNIFKEDLQVGNQGIIGNFLIISSQQNSQAILNEYVNVSTIDSSQKDFIKPMMVSPYGSGVSINKINLFMINTKFYTEFFSRIILVLGAIILLLFRNRAKNYIIDEENFSIYKWLSLLTLLIGGIFIVLPFFSVSYDLSRFYNQIILIVAPLTILGFLIISDTNKKKNLFYFIISLFIIFYFLNIGGLFLTFNNNPEVSMRFANYGREYSYYSLHRGEEYSLSWITNKKDINEIRTDSKIRSRSLFLVGPDKKLEVIPSILTTDLNKGKIFLSGYNNKINNFAWISYKSYWMPINLPTQFLNNNKNKIYNNGGSEIFK